VSVRDIQPAWGAALESLVAVFGIGVRWKLASARSGGHTGDTDEELRERASYAARNPFTGKWTGVRP
jgi:hypothetical protein